MNWLSLLNLILPSATNLIILLKNESGSTTALISTTETATAAEISQIQAYLQAHQAGTAVKSATPAPTT